MITAPLPTHGVDSHAVLRKRMVQLGMASPSEKDEAVRRAIENQAALRRGEPDNQRDFWLYGDDP